MDESHLALRIGNDLQLIIAAARDLPSTLAPHRARRYRRKAKLAAGLGGATSAMVGGAMWAANLGFWASVGAALGLGSVPVVATLAGTGVLALGLPRRRSASPNRQERQRDQVALTYACFMRLAQADGRISEEERVILRSVLHQYPLSDEEVQAIQDAAPEEVLASAAAHDELIRRQVLQGTWMLAETDGVTPEEEECFATLAAALGLASEERELKRQSRDLQAGVNDLVTAMFRSCQLLLSPVLGRPPANAFLEALGQLAATPTVRRSLRNSLTDGFSAGGVARLIDEHPDAPKLVAQAYNGARAVHGGDAGELKEAQARLAELSGGAKIGARSAREICADIDQLFEESIAAARAAAS